MRDSLLEAAGWQVVPVPFNAWAQLGSLQEKQARGRATGVARVGAALRQSGTLHSAHALVRSAHADSACSPCSTMPVAGLPAGAYPEPAGKVGRPRICPESRPCTTKLG